MSLSLSIPRLSNFLSFLRHADSKNLPRGGYSFRKLFSEEDIDTLVYGQDDEVQEQIKGRIGIDETKNFEDFLRTAEPFFSSYWDSALKKLSEWERYFRNHERLFADVFPHVEKICGVRNFDVSAVPVYLVADFSHDDTELDAWFSWSPERTFVVVEIPLGFRVPASTFPVGILVHEFFHLALRRNSDLLSYIREVAERNEEVLRDVSDGMPIGLFLEELVVSSFVPEGCLGREYFGTEVVVGIGKPQDMVDWRRFAASELHETASDYVHHGRTLDANYLAALVRVVKRDSKMKNPS